MPTINVYNPRGYNIDGIHEVIPGAVALPTGVRSNDGTTKGHNVKVNATVTAVPSSDGRVLMSVAGIVS
jgi:hypothetical protein